MINIQQSINGIFLSAGILFYTANINAQVRWINADAAYAPLPTGFHVYTTTDSLDGKPFVAYYAVASLTSKKLQFTTDTTYKRRLTPAKFFEKNQQPLLVVNTTFFSFATHQNLNVVIKKGKIVSCNIHSVSGRGKDTLTYRHPFNGALGISKHRKPDVAWIYADSSKKIAYASQSVVEAVRDSVSQVSFKSVMNRSPNKSHPSAPTFFNKWKMQTAVGGGPVLVQNGQVKITNNEELKFAGKAIDDQHPRTLIGYTNDHQLIIMVIEGRNKGVAEGASLLQAAKLMVGLGCTEALNLDGGGSSCMLINGKQTIKPSDTGIQRAVPAVFIIHYKGK
ncbi:MAG: phosphodiester glycosidase family protein [Ferruginibacter sp.]|nr:phosphodiester glycosidase family protein [Ferruginibacter sp.]